MNTFLSATLLLLLQSTMPGGQHGLLRNAFRTATESVVDSALAIDPAASDTQYAPMMTQLKQTQTNLTEMAADEREREIVDETKNLIFTVSACHIQAGGDAAKAAGCRPRVEHAAHEVEVLLNRHKANGSWQDGAPA
jgi:hypothetical protein